ncbi:acyltransferase family protein [Thiolapillus sp.]
MHISDRVRQRNNSFTLIRFLAAYAVLYVHSYGLALGKPGQDVATQWVKSWWGQSLGELAVMIFFVISGFLVGGSYIHRASPVAFAEARLLRIFPALFAAVVLSVFVVGWYATTMGKQDFLFHPQVWSYVGKNLWLLDGIQYRLPGVFEHNPRTAAVNGSLWTLPIELYMYIMVFALGIAGILKKRWAFNLFFVLLLCFVLGLNQGWFNLSHPYMKHHDLVLAYATGVFFYVNREYISLRLSWVVVVLLIMIVLRDSFLWVPVKILGLGYLLMTVALHPSLQLPSMDALGDFSYGVYVYAFPVQQLIVQDVSRSPTQVLILSTMIVLPLAAISWFLLEKPALRLKGRLLPGRKWFDPRVESNKQ